ncbi:MAG: class I SAM-dependent DNA methyltransferase, partial [Spirochaetes bacterium]|nr:class I SAM-dependent DNA methyltransferase [Spirochaetota bacterium]
MNSENAIKIISETFDNAFDENKFRYFIKNLLNETTEYYIDVQKDIPNIFVDHINYYKRIGTYTDNNNNELEILIVNLKKETGLTRARTMQRDFVADYLKNNVDNNYALVAYFYNDIEDWRFSFVKMSYETSLNEKRKVIVENVLNPPKRFSFLVGSNEPNHTAQQYLVPILCEVNKNPTIDDIEKAFNIESVTKE